jgi:hypothetical protein
MAKDHMPPTMPVIAVESDWVWPRTAEVETSAITAQAAVPMAARHVG